ncbi:MULTISPECIES: response regulator transcription factor [unclassified Synechococcus]|uniref:helix-turn-helix transcriptional regulator n=1 Tax=unclassified Synechococcus TaxID=2626047 RepID=UPI0028F45BDA|nr:MULTISPECIES: response regulator transcription factor [unclassified Synechococcus]
MAHQLTNTGSRDFLGNLGGRILIASEHRILLSAIQAILSLEQALDHQLTDSESDAIVNLQSRPHGLLICTQGLSLGSGASLVKQARSIQTDLAILFLINKKSELKITRQIDPFCNAIIAEWDLGHPEEPLASAFLTIAETITTYRSTSIRAYIQESQRHAAENLTPREKTVLDLILTGMSNKEIADQLFLSPSTVKSYSRDVIRKLGVKNRQQAILRAIELGLLEQQP